MKNNMEGQNSNNKNIKGGGPMSKYRFDLLKRDQKERIRTNSLSFSNLFSRLIHS